MTGYCASCIVSAVVRMTAAVTRRHGSNPNLGPDKRYLSHLGGTGWVMRIMKDHESTRMATRCQWVAGREPEMVCIDWRPSYGRCTLEDRQKGVWTGWKMLQCIQI